MVRKYNICTNINKNQIAFIQNIRCIATAGNILVIICYVIHNIFKIHIFCFAL